MAYTGQPLLASTPIKNRMIYYSLYVFADGKCYIRIMKKIIQFCLAVYQHYVNKLNATKLAFFQITIRKSTSSKSV